MLGTKRCRINILTAYFIAAVMLLASCSGGISEVPGIGGNSYTITVMLLPDEGMTVIGENPMRVSPGGDAVFSVRLEEGKYIENLSGGAVYKDGRVTVSAVNMPLTVNVKTAQKKLVDSETNPGSNDSVPVDLSAPEGKFLVIYNANGGEVNAADTRSITVNGGGVLTELSSSEFYICPNALPDKGYLSRKGYVLLGYSTKPDGSGEFYGCGWNIIMPPDRVIELYAVWVPESAAGDFTFKLSDGKATVTNYSGNDDFVVIPLMYNGFEVTAVAAGAFRGGTVKTVFITKNILTVEKSAFTRCTNLSTIYMSDSVQSITDTSFLECPNLSTLNISAVMNPVYTTNKHGTYAVKFELLYTAQGRKIFGISGSNLAYGLDSPALMGALDFESTIINFGFNWHTPTLMQMEIALRYAAPGDILLLAPELSAAQFGGVAAYTTMWQMFEACYEAVSYIDIKNYTGIFDTFANFNKNRPSMTPRSYDDRDRNVNIYGDYTIYRPAKGEDYIYAGQAGMDFGVQKFLTDAGMMRMRDMFARFYSRGCHVWMSFASINQNGLSDASKDPVYRTAWVDAIRDKLGVTVISDIENYVYPGNYFYDSNFHLSTEATEIRTQKLADDINAAYAAIK